MSEQDNSGTNTPEPKDEGAGESITNVKAEVARKLDALRDDFTQSNQQLSAQIQALMQNIEGRQTAGKSSAAQEKKLSELIYENPDEFVSSVESRVAQTIETKMNKQSAFNAAAIQLENEYPEFRDRSSEAYKRVQAHYSSLPQNLQGTKEGLEIAALRAASEQGLVPSSKRRATQNEDFSLSGQQGATKTRKPANQDGEMAADQRAMAELMGIDVNNPKFKAEFKKATDRKTYGKYK